MLVVQVFPTSLIRKCQQKTPASKTLYRALSLNIYGGGKFLLTVDKLDLMNFLKGQDVSHSSS